MGASSSHKWKINKQCIKNKKGRPLSPKDSLTLHLLVEFTHLISSRSVEKLVKNNSMLKKYRNGITKQEANDLFISDLSVTEEGVKKASESPFIPM